MILGYRIAQTDQITITHSVICNVNYRDFVAMLTAH